MDSEETVRWLCCLCQDKRRIWQRVVPASKRPVYWTSPLSSHKLAVELHCWEGNGDHTGCTKELCPQFCLQLHATLEQFLLFSPPLSNLFCSFLRWGFLGFYISLWMSAQCLPRSNMGAVRKTRFSCWALCKFCRLKTSFIIGQKMALYHLVWLIFEYLYNEY